MSGKGSGKFIVKLSDQTAFGPKLTVKVTKTEEKGKFLLQIVHPNKTVPVLNAKGEEIVDKRSGRKKLVGAVLYEQIVENNNVDELKAFLEVQAIGNKMVNPPYFDKDANNGKGGYVGGEFHNYKTEYQEILFIPAARKGKAKLKTKKSIVSGADGEVDNHYDEQEEMQDIEYSEEDLNQDDLDEQEIQEPIAKEVYPKVIVVGKKRKNSAKPKEEKTKKQNLKKEKVKNNNKNNKKAKVVKKTKAKTQKLKNKKKGRS